MDKRLKGKLEYRSFESNVLKDNPLGDPTLRDLIVYTPENYNNNNSPGYPTIFFYSLRLVMIVTLPLDTTLFQYQFMKD